MILRAASGTLLKAIHAEGARAFMQLNYPKERIFDREVPGRKAEGRRMGGSPWSEL